MEKDSTNILELSTKILIEPSKPKNLANVTAIATTAAHRYALAKLDVHVATMVSVH